MHWSLFVLLGGTINACTNFGYKTRANQPGPLVFAGMVFTAGAVGLLVYSWVHGFENIQLLMTPQVLLLALAMGVGTAGIISCMMKAFAQAGPISLVDPMWACIYSLGSVSLGMLVAFEKPSKWALLGIMLYLCGAYLMAHGKASGSDRPGREDRKNRSNSKERKKVRA